MPGQATSYMCTVWEALAHREDVPMEQLRVTFQDVSIKQAVQAQADEDVTLKVLLDQSGRFQAWHPAPITCNSM